MSIESSRVRELFLRALERESSPEREAFLLEACAGDPELRRRVDALLLANDKPDSILDRPAADVLPTTGDTAGLDFLAPSRKPGSLGRLGQYEVLNVVGRGGMGIVLRAFDEKLQRIVAIKILKHHFAESGEYRQRFVREARAAAAVNHEHVIGIHAVEDDGPTPFLVMQYIAGRTLQEKIDATGPLPLHETLRIGFQIAEGLAAAHRQGLIHRDIKPANILLENGIERVKITDFGLARAVDDSSITRTGIVVGTPEYMSPEQANGDKLDYRSDLFSLGSVLYVLCSGREPFQANSAMAVLRRVCDAEPTPLWELNPAVPRWLEMLVGKLQAKQPEDRFASASEVASTLSCGLARLQSGAASSITTPVARLAPSGRRWGRPALALSLVVLLVGAAWGIRELTQDPPKDGGTGDRPSIQNEQPSEIPAKPVTLTSARTLESHSGEVLAIAFSPDGKTLATAGEDRDIRLWSVETWQIRGTLSGSAGNVVCLTFSRDGVQLASVVSNGDSCGVRLWDPVGAKATKTLGTELPGMWGVAFSPDGTRVAAAGFGRRLHVWEVATGDQVVTIPDVCPGHVRGLDYSPKGERIVTGGTGPTRIWDAKSGREIPASLPEGMTPSFAPAGSDTVVGWIFLAGQFATCDVPTGVVRSKKAHNLIEGLAVTRDGRCLASVGRDGIAKVWTTAEHDEIATLNDQADATLSVAFSPDGRYLATGGKDGKVRIWELPVICHSRK